MVKDEQTYDRDSKLTSTCLTLVTHMSENDTFELGQNDLKETFTILQKTTMYEYLNDSDI